MRKMYLSVFLAVSVFVLCSPWYCIGVDINGCAPCKETLFVFLLVFLVIFVFVFALAYCILYWGGLALGGY